MQLLKGLIVWLKTILSDIRQALVGLAVGALAAISVGRLVYLYITARDATIATMTTPTPLWITTLLVLVCCVYIYLKFRKLHSSDNSSNSVHKGYAYRYRTIGDYKWKVKIFPSSDYFQLEHYPFCAKHDYQFIMKDNMSCPDPECKNNISKYDEFQIKATATSIIEREIRSKDMSHFTDK